MDTGEFTVNWQKILFGGFLGFLGSAVADLDAYRRREDQSKPFDFGTAFPRWVIGFILGAGTAAGIEG